jgi:hypothetical protein
MTSVSAALKRSKSWVWSRKLRVLVLVIILVLTAPWPARGQALSPCCAILAAGLSSIANSLKTIASSLSAILGVDKEMLQFEQTVVWPTSAIIQAQALVGSQQGIFARIQALIHIPVNSATQPNPATTRGDSSFPHAAGCVMLGIDAAYRCHAVKLAIGPLDHSLRVSAIG